MNGFDRRRQRKMQAIRDAALHLFLQHGFHKVSIGDIAKKANVSQVTIYNYFGSKEGLIFDAVKSYVEQIIQEYENLINSDKPYKEKVEAIIFDKAESARMMHPDFAESILFEYPQLRQYLDEVYQKRVIPMMIRFIEDGKRQGYIAPHLSLEAILLYIRLFIQMAEDQKGEIYKDPARLQTFSRDLTHLFFYGLIGKKDAGDDPS